MPPGVKKFKGDGSQDGDKLKLLLGPVLQVPPDKNSPMTSIEANCYLALETPGAFIADNTDMLGHVGNGALLKTDSRLYLGFASPSDHSVTQITTLLMVYHDTETKHLYPLFKSFQMSKTAQSLGGAPGTHACLDIDFSCPESDNVETVQLFYETVSLIVATAVLAFVRKYKKTFSLPVKDDKLSEVPLDLKSFLPWLPKIGMKLFVTVRNMQRILRRFLDAAMCEEFKGRGSTLGDRLGIIRILVLNPLWEHLDGNGVVRKLLLVDSSLLQQLIRPPESTKFKSLPVFRDLTSHDTLHGYTPTQIRTLYKIDRGKVPREFLGEILQFCNCVMEPFSGSAIFTPESVDTVFNGINQRLDMFRTMSLAAVQKRLCAKFLTIHRDRVLGTLYPLLRRDDSFLAVAEGLLKDTPLTQGHGSVFSLASLIAASTPEEKAQRLFLTGLLKKVKQEDGAQPDLYRLAGGCARLLLADAVAQATKFYARTRVKVEHPNVEDLVKKFFTEDNLAKVILEHYRDVPIDRLPKDEAGFQADLAEILRAALEQYLGDAGFPSDVQVEVWLRDGRPWSERISSRNLRFDIAIRIRGVGSAADRLFILELKYFSLEDTKKATYAHLDELNKGRHTRDRLVLESRTAANSSARFRDELRSILQKTLEEFSKDAAREPGTTNTKGAPVHWRVPAGPPPCELRFAFSPAHIQCNYKEHPPKPSERAATPDPIPRIKTAVEVARGSVGQAANYGVVSTQGVADQVGHGSGFADARFTDLGPGKTIIVCFSIVNIAGALVFVKAHQELELARRLAIVGAYPWSHDPTYAETKAILDAKRKYDSARRR